MNRPLAALATLAAMALAPAWADKAHHGSGAGSANSADAPFVDGEVKKVDKDAGKVTIKHGPLVSLDMPAMTMVFRVKDPAMLEEVKAGDNIRFKAAKVQGAYTVTEYQAAK